MMEYKGYIGKVDFDDEAVSGKSLNAWVAEQLQAGVQRVGVGKATGKRATAKAGAKFARKAT